MNVTGLVFAVALLITMQFLVVNVLHRAPGLQRWRIVIVALGLLWWAVPFAKKAYVDDLFYPNDSIVHEETAREIAYLMSEGDWHGALDYFGFGNDGYRFVLGGFYAITDAPEVTTYGVHGLLSFWGMLSILEVVCRITAVRKVPLWVILLVLGNPSTIFWTTFNLKEGAMLWGICLLLRFAVRFKDRPTREAAFWPTLGFLVAGFLRPHILMTYLAGLALAVAIRQRQVGLALVAVTGMVVAATMLKTMAPIFYEQLVHNGIDETLNEKFNELNSDGGSAITYARGTPTPLVSGFLLLTLRPFPWEVTDVMAAAAGVEIWAISAAALIGWYSLQRRMPLLTSSYVMTLLMAMIAISFYFSYMYNMGLMVRQRVMAFPALISLAVLPALAMANQRSICRIGGRIAADRRPPRPGSPVADASPATSKTTRGAGPITAMPRPIRVRHPPMQGHGRLLQEHHDP